MTPSAQHGVRHSTLSRSLLSSWEALGSAAFSHSWGGATLPAEPSSRPAGGPGLSWPLWAKAHGTGAGVRGAASVAEAWGLLQPLLSTPPSLGHHTSLSPRLREAGWTQITVPS